MARKKTKRRPRNPREKSSHKTSGAWYVMGDRGQKIYIANPGDWYWNIANAVWLFQFGAYGATWVAVWEHNLDDALEEAARWLAQHAPGHLTTEEELWKDKSHIADAMKDMGVSGPFDELDEEEQYDVRLYMTEDMTYTESGYLNSWEWHVNELPPGDPEYKKILVESAREDQNAWEDYEMVEAYQKALAATRGSKRRTNMSGQDYAKKRKRGKRSKPKRSRSRKKAVSGRKRNPDTAAAKRRCMR